MVVAAFLSEVRKKPEKTPEIAVRANELKIHLNAVGRSNEPDEVVGKPLQIVAVLPHLSDRWELAGVFENCKNVSELQESFQPLRQQLERQMVESL